MTFGFETFPQNRAGRTAEFHVNQNLTNYRSASLFMAFQKSMSANVSTGVDRSVHVSENDDDVERRLFDFDFDFDLRGFILDEPFPKKLFAPTSSIAKEYCCCMQRTRIFGC
jgi:hypothetical protein